MERIRIEDINGPVYITPLSGVALLVYHMLKEHGIEVLGFCDSDEGKCTKEYDGRPILSREKAVRGRADSVFVIVSYMFEREIEEEIVALGVSDIIFAQQFMEADRCYDCRELGLIIDESAVDIVSYTSRDLIQYDSFSYYYTDEMLSDSCKILDVLSIDSKYYGVEVGMKILESAKRNFDFIKDLTIISEDIEFIMCLLEEVLREKYRIVRLNIRFAAAADASAVEERLEGYNFPIYRCDSTRLYLSNRLYNKHKPLEHIVRVKVTSENSSYSKLELSKKYIYTHIFKNSGTSMQEYLNPGSFMINYSERLLVHKRKNPELFKEFFKFTIVRNPWDRLVSIYFYNQRIFRENGYLQLEESLQNLIREQRAFWQPTFKEFVLGLSKADYINDRFTKNQCYWVCDDDGNILADYVGRFEDIDQCYNYIGKRLGIDAERKIPKVNMSKHSSYQTYYDKQTRDIVQNIYERDIEIFGYKFD